MRLLNAFNQAVNSPDLAKLLLRVSFSALFLLHGIHKLESGLGFIEGKFVEFGLPASLAYLTYIAEIVTPILMILGVFTRISAFVTAIGCVVIVVLMHSHDFFTLTRVGAWAVEGVATYLIGFTAITLLGSGKYALKAD